MKRNLLMLALGALVGFSSCDKLDEITSLALPTTLENPVTLSISETDTNLFMEEFLVDISSDQDIKDNLSKISDVNLQKISFKVTSFTGDPVTIATGDVQFFDDLGNIGDPILIEPFNFKQMVDDATEVEIPVSNELKSTLEERLMSNNSFAMKIYGMVSTKPIEANMVILVKLEAKVDVK